MADRVELPVAWKIDLMVSTRFAYRKQTSLWQLYLQGLQNFIYEKYVLIRLYNYSFPIPCLLYHSEL